MKLQKPISLNDMTRHLMSRGMKAEVFGEDRLITGISPVESCEKGDITFASGKEFLVRAIETPCSAIVLAHKLFSDMKLSVPDDKSCLVVDQPGLAHAWLKQAFADWDFRDTNEWGRIHPSAILHAEAKIHETATVGPKAVIGRGAEIGENAVVMAGCVIETGVVIAENTILHPNVVVGRNCRIGRNCIIRPGSIIGSEGFGFAQDEKRRHHRIPQTGIVVIEDDCVVGANNAIDRATYGETILRKGTILDNLVHLAHNVEVGEDSILLAQTVIAGSTKLGKRVICSGQTGILDHLNVPDDTVLLARAGVLESIEKPGAYAGTPALPLTTFHRINLHLKNLDQLVKEVKALKKRIGVLEGNPPGHSG